MPNPSYIEEVEVRNLSEVIEEIRKSLVSLDAAVAELTKIKFGVGLTTGVDLDEGVD